VGYALFLWCEKMCTNFDSKVSGTDGKSEMVANTNVPPIVENVQINHLFLIRTSLSNYKNLNFLEKLMKA
jgi:hypothetical protein